MRSTHEMFMDAGLFDEKEVETRVRLAMYHLQTERFDRTLSDARSRDGNALYQNSWQADAGCRYARELWDKLRLNYTWIKDRRLSGNLSFEGLTHFLLQHLDIVEQIENE